MTNKVQSLTIAASGGEFEIGDGTNSESLLFNATFEELQDALDLVLGSGNSTVTGGPGDETGSSPYIITYQGSLTGADYPDLIIDASLLTGNYSLETVTHGSGYEGESWVVGGELYQDGSIANYDLNPEKFVKIFRYASLNEVGSRKEPPINLNYISGLNRRLYKKEYITQGELRKVEFYADSGTDAFGWPSYSDLILKEEMSYTRDSTGFARARTTTISWCLEDGTFHPITKILHKKYSPMSSQQEGITRRKNIIDTLSVGIAGFLMALLPTNETYPDSQAKLEIARQFARDHKDPMDLFIIASDHTAVSVVKHATEWWLDLSLVPLGYPEGTTIRQYIRSELDIWNIWDAV